jgi:hypothetical protein
LGTMTENSQGRQRRQTKTWLALSALAVVIALVIVPPFISVRRYKNRITQVISRSVGRPVRLSSVELRILPRPSFVITDLVVQEDPAYGAEPVLHASSVTASIRLLPLWWRARLEISRISVDEASLNLVRNSAGHWNLDSFLRSAAARAKSGGTDGGAMPFPYLEATDSRINIKDGVEKLPYSLVNADVSFWQDSPGEWRVRLKGQPARTDVSLDLADTGIVRLEGRMRRAPELRRAPIHLDVEWREAQLGQLTRLVLGNDQGWRGDLTGEIHVDGTADSAQVRTRLRAAGVHRAEFAPASPIDFDASCSLIYRYSDRSLEKLLCDSPVGNGRARLSGEVQGQGASPRLTLELDRVPAQLALDALRTVRSGIDPSLQASGAISGKMDYASVDALAGASRAVSPARPGARSARIHAPPPGPLSGSISVAGLRVSGDALVRPILVPKVTVEPAPGQPPALIATVALAEGAPTPLNFTARLSMNTYQVGIRGAAAWPRLKELAHVAGVGHASDLDTLDGPPATLDLTASGPWLAASPPLHEEISTVPVPSAPPIAVGASDHINGTITLHAASWKAAFLANSVDIANATLRFDENGARWDPVAFTYGPVKGMATLTVPGTCAAPEKCAPQFTVSFGSLDAAALQAAILGARQPGTLLASLLSRLRPASAPALPELEGSVLAHTLVLGPVTLNDVNTAIHIQADGAAIESLDAGLFGGHLHAKGIVVPGDKPDYKLEGRFDKLNAAEMGRLLGMTWTGNALDGEGQVELVGFTDKDLATSAKGSLHFDWRGGAIADNGEVDTPPALAKFDRWTAEAEIANGAITLKENHVQQGSRKLAVEGSATFGDPPRVTFGEPQDARAAAGQSKQ